MESVSKITVFGLDMMVNSGLEKIYEIYESVKWDVLNYFTGLDSMKMHYCAIVATGQLCKFEGQPMRSLKSSCETIDLDPPCCICTLKTF